MTSLSIPTLLHLSDSALPVGAYAHSFGLEGLCQAGIVESVSDFERFLLRDVAHALLSVDLPLAALAWQSDAESLVELDQLSRAARPSRQLREAASKIGRQQRKIFRDTWELTIPTLPHDQSPVVTGALLKRAGVDLETTAWSLAFQTYSALTQASLKLLPLGPQATQRLLTLALREIAPKIGKTLTLSPEEVGTFNPVWDIAACAHERAPARLFLS